MYPKEGIPIQKRKRHVLAYLSYLFAVLALLGIILAAKKYSFLMQVGTYEDQGIMEFTATEWYTKTETLRQRYTPSYTRYHYYVRYMSARKNGVSYSYHERVSSIKEAKRVSYSKDKIQRRVLGSEDTYITVSPEQTKMQWLYQTNTKYLIVFLISAIYLLFFVISLIKRKWLERIMSH